MFTVEVGPIRGGGRKGAKRFEILLTPLIRNNICRLVCTLPRKAHLLQPKMQPQKVSFFILSAPTLMVLYWLLKHSHLSLNLYLLSANVGFLLILLLSCITARRRLRVLRILNRCIH